LGDRDNPGGLLSDGPGGQQSDDPDSRVGPDARQWDAKAEALLRRDSRDHHNRHRPGNVRRACRREAASTHATTAATEAAAASSGKRIIRNKARNN
jgi:hypothetical protein